MSLAEHPIRVRNVPKHRSAMRKHSVVIDNHKTSLSLEPEFWEGLKAIAVAENITMMALVARIDAVRGDCNNMSSACRVFLLKHLQKQLAEAQ